MFQNLVALTLRTLTSYAAISIIAASMSHTRADVLLYDPFSIGLNPGDYLLGNEGAGLNVLGTQNPVPSPTAFYTGGWIQSGGDSQAVMQGTLKYPNFPRAGGHVSDAVQFSCCSFGRSAREIAGGLDIQPDRTIYQSFLVDFGNQGTDDLNEFGKRGVEWWYDGVGDANLAVDLYVNSFSGTNDFTLAVTTPSGTNSALLNGGGLNLANMAGVHLIVMKFEFRRVLADVVSVYLDPTDSIEANWTPVAVVSAPSSDLRITHHGVSTNFTFSGGGHVPARFDELRWGDTFADVTPFVPEPASLSLAVLGIAKIVRTRRGKFARNSRIRMNVLTSRYL